MIFILGFITGVLVSLLLLVIETYLDIRKKKIVEIIKEVVVDKVKEKGAIIPPETDKEVARENMINYNKEKGRTTTLEDLDL